MLRTSAILLCIVLSTGSAYAQRLATGIMLTCADSIDFGHISEDRDTASVAFPWHNASDEALSVVMVSTTCACLEAEYDMKPVPAGGNGEIRLVYHPKGHPGKFSHKVFVYTGTSREAPAAALTVTGTVIPSSKPVWQYPYRIGNLLLRRTDVNVTGDKPQVERIACMNAGDTAIRPTAEPGTLPDGFSFRCEPEVLAPGQGGDLVTAFDPDKATDDLPDRFTMTLLGTGNRDEGQKITVIVRQTAAQGTFEYPRRK